MPPSGGEPIESTNCSPAVSRSFLFSPGQNGGMKETLVLLHVSRAGRIGEQKKKYEIRKDGYFLTPPSSRETNISSGFWILSRLSSCSFSTNHLLDRRGHGRGGPYFEIYSNFVRLTTALNRKIIVLCEFLATQFSYSNAQTKLSAQDISIESFFSFLPTVLPKTTHRT